MHISSSWLAKLFNCIMHVTFRYILSYIICTCIVATQLIGSDGSQDLIKKKNKYECQYIELASQLQIECTKLELANDHHQMNMGHMAEGHQCNQCKPIKAFITTCMVYPIMLLSYICRAQLAYAENEKQCQNHQQLQGTTHDGTHSHISKLYINDNS